MAEPAIFCSFSLRPINQTRARSKILNQELYSSWIWKQPVPHSIKLNWLKDAASCSLSFISLLNLNRHASQIIMRIWFSLIIKKRSTSHSLLSWKYLSFHCWENENAELFVEGNLALSLRRASQKLQKPKFFNNFHGVLNRAGNKILVLKL